MIFTTPSLPETWSVWLLYVATFLWVFFNTLALWDVRGDYKRGRLALEEALTLGNGKVIAARRNVRRKRWSYVGFGADGLIGILAVTALLFLPDPSPDVSLYTAFLRILFIVSIFGFWRANRVDRIALRERDEYESVRDTVDDLKEDTHETRRMVSEMQEQHNEERPGVVKDQDEGSDHRGRA